MRVMFDRAAEHGSRSVDFFGTQLTLPPEGRFASMSSVQRYVDDVLACLNALGTTDRTPPDCIALGVVHTPSGWCRIEDVTDAASQARLVARHPQLFGRLAEPTPTVEWLVAARQPELLQARPPRACSVRYAVRATLGPAVPSAFKDAVPAAFATEDVHWPGYVAPRGVGVAQ